ncbi:MAG: N-acetyl-gamma-glutamyl-phosphate reductase [Treponema sp.]|jgi:N-acetyl-gamma-glutamyl-phosphate reductase|nr:N-acetyl-gamma-glutamyl-phosphate reductase [Treponema sp.]
MIAGIIGAAGYAGAELVRLLTGHPEVDALAPASVNHGGERIEDMYLNFWGQISAPLESPEAVIERADVIFTALPSGVGEPYAKAALERGISCIDLSADFRFGEDEAAFSAWYGKPYVFPELRKRSVYGLPELNRAKLKALAAEGPVIIGNPGCYPTGASLGAFPALARGLAGAGVIIVDSASGVTGGGREPQRSFHYPECADTMAPYKVGAHRHTPEISRNFQAMAALNGQSAAPALIFTPHLAPMNRGILSTIYIPLAEPRQAGRNVDSKGGSVRPPSKEINDRAAEFREIYADFYRKEPFVPVLPSGVVAATGRVRCSNFCHISVHLDPGGTTLIVVSALDNMVKGAAGQAVQNMNILFGFDERTGLGQIPASF